jgi:acetyl esterase
MTDVEYDKLDPNLASFLMEFNNANYPPIRQIPVEIRRILYEKFALMHGGSLIPVARIEDGITNQDLPIRVYTPELGKKLPAILYFHGGGWQIGSHTTHDIACRHLANYSNCIVISVEWRLAPTHKFPAAINDCMDSYLWLKSNSDAFNIDPSKIAIAGDSAGGNIVAATVNKLRDLGKPLPGVQVLIYPALDLSCSSKSCEEFKTGYSLTKENVKYYIETYLNEHDSVENSDISPLKHSSFKGLPYTYIITAGFDPLRDEGYDYAEKLKEANVKVTYKCYQDMIHAFLHLTGTVPKVKEIIEEIGSNIKLHFSN